MKKIAFYGDECNCIIPINEMRKLPIIKIWFTILDLKYTLKNDILVSLDIWGGLGSQDFAIIRDKHFLYPSSTSGIQISP